MIDFKSDVLHVNECQFSVGRRQWLEDCLPSTGNILSTLAPTMKEWIFGAGKT